MSRLIIDNRSSLSDEVALLWVACVIEGGRISNDGKQYCYYSTFGRGEKKFGIATGLNEKSDKFTVIDQPK